jgi:hypothetical protein
MGIEPTSEASEALNKTLKAIDLAALRYLARCAKLETRWKLKILFALRTSLGLSHTALSYDDLAKHSGDYVRT